MLQEQSSKVFLDETERDNMKIEIDRNHVVK
jgi:hypothetical protein